MTTTRGWEAIYESGLADLARWAPEGVTATRDGEVLELRRGDRVVYADPMPHLRRGDEAVHVRLWSPRGPRVKLVGRNGSWEIFSFDNVPLRVEWAERRVRTLIDDLFA